ncbi:MAG: DpnII family type II restriction endonuclease [Megamonas funiformis]|uniref:DpnII family type II restriction endonuclease n=1 Tax=Megamonas funiformis TaxID=437897 RepID=UPI003996C5AA
MKNRDFDKWLSTMNDSIATWKYYTDFEKVYKNAEKIKTEIYILNSLINNVLC